MNIQTEHARSKASITNEQALRIENFDNPATATNEVSRHDIVTACALIDSMSPLGAAFILNILRTRAQYGDSNARAIVERAQKLEIRGIKGLCAARDEMYLSTGIFVT